MENSLFRLRMGLIKDFVYFFQINFCSWCSLGLHNKKSNDKITCINSARKLQEEEAHIWTVWVLLAIIEEIDQHIFHSITIGALFNHRPIVLVIATIHTTELSIAINGTKTLSTFCQCSWQFQNFPAVIAHFIFRHISFLAFGRTE